MSKDFFLYDSHIHTVLCGHATGRPASYAWRACRRNLKGLIFTCHNPMPSDFCPNVRMNEDELKYYVELVMSIKEMFEGMLDVRLGLECDWLPGYEDYLETQIDSYDFDYILGSVHANFPEYLDAYVTGEPSEDIARYFSMQADLAETGLIDCLAHPDHIKFIYPDQWQTNLDLGPIREAFERIAAADVSLEVNTSGFYKSIPELTPSPQLLTEAASCNCTMVLGSDAHQPERVADDFELALGMLNSFDIATVSHYIERERVDVEVTKALHSLTPA